VIHSTDANRLTQPRIATALCLAVLLAVGSATGLLWQRLAASTVAQLDMQRALVSLDSLVLQQARGDSVAPGTDVRAQVSEVVGTIRAGGRFPSAVDGVALAATPDAAGTVDAAAYLQARAALESDVIAAASTTEAQRVMILASSAGIAGILVVTLAGVLLADARRRRRPVASPAAPVTSGSFDNAALHHDLDVAARRAIDTGSPLAAVMVEVDHLDVYAQTQGAAAAEALLAEVSEIVEGAVRTSDGAYRCDESTFVLMLPDTDCLAAVRLAERLRESIVRSLLSEGVTVSAGVAGIPTGARAATDLLAAAAAALADATRQGRNQVRRSAVPADELAAARENVGLH